MKCHCNVKDKTQAPKLLGMNTEIKELVAEGKVDEALDKLVALLASQVEKFPPLYRAAQVAQSEYNQIKERELQGVLTEDQIRLANNVAINRILEILEQIDRGPSLPPTPSPSRTWIWYAIGGALVAIVVFLLVSKSTGEDNKTPIGEIPPSGDTLQSSPPPCPSFAKGNQYGIAVFNFTTLNPKDSITDQLLVEQIDGIFARNQFKGDAVLIDKIKGSVDLSVAREMIENCGARMVIWGRVFDNSEIELNFYEPQLNADQQAELDSSLQFRNQGNFQASIKQAALIIAARVLVVNNANGAVAVAEKAYDETMKDNTSGIAAKSSRKSNTASMATMTLANAHAKNRDYKKSIPLYHQILDKNPKDTVARKNLVIVDIKTNNIDVALKNLDTLRNHQKKEDPALLDKVGDELTKRGLTRKGAEFKKDAQRIIIDQRDNKKLPPKQ